MDRRRFLKMSGVATLVAASPMMRLLAPVVRKTAPLRRSIAWKKGSIHVRLYSNGGEVEAPCYRPRLVAFTPAKDERIRNSTRVEFPQAEQDWENGRDIRYFSLCDWRNRPLFFGKLKVPKPVLFDDIVVFDIGEIDVGIEDFTDFGEEDAFRFIQRWDV